MSVEAAGKTIEQVVTSWPGVTEAAHRFGGKAFYLGNRELGHVHGDALVDIPFPLSVRNELIQSGVARVHRYAPESGWVSVDLSTPSDVQRSIELFRRSYEIASERDREHKQQSGRRQTASRS